MLNNGLSPALLIGSGQRESGGKLKVVEYLVLNEGTRATSAAQVKEGAEVWESNDNNDVIAPCSKWVSGRSGKPVSILDIKLSPWFGLHIRR